MTPEGKKTFQKRRWWQRLCRIVIFVVLPLAAAYVTLPWWLPADYLRGCIVRRMREQLGADVQIGRMSLSWSEGVVIRNFTIASPEGFAASPLLSVDRIQAAFSPVDLVFRNRIEWMELDRPQLAVQLNRNGELNVEPLRRLRGGAETDRLSIRRGTVTLRFPDSDRPLRVDVSDLQLVGRQLGQLGRITMSARLDQQGRRAAISLSAAAGGRGSAGTVSFNFDNVDLGQLPLIELFALPLKKLAGRCNGTIGLQVRNGQVDRFNFNLAIGNLDVQPRRGPPLPVIDQAGLRISARIDLVTEQVHVHSARLRLPGIDLAGRMDFSAEVLKGNWQAVSLLELEGLAYPMRLATLLLGQAGLPDKLAIAGPVKVKFLGRRRGMLLRVETTVDATSIAIRQAGRTLKPAGRKLLAHLAGDIDRRNWRFVVDHSELTLGGNTLTGAGELRDARPLAERWGGRGRPMSPGGFLQDISRLNWKGSWEIRDLASLRRLGPVWADVLGGVRLGGAVGGKWAIEHPSGRLRLDCAATGATQLEIGEFFRKPPSKILAASVSARIDAQSSALTDVKLDLAIGAGRFRLVDGRVTVADGAPGGGDGLLLNAAGRFDADRIEALAECFPRLPASAGRFGGEMQGRYVFGLGDGDIRAQVRADLTGATADGGGYFTKPAGQATRLDVDFCRDTTVGAAEGDTLTLAIRCPQLAAQIRLSRPGPDDGDKAPPVTLQAAARIRQAGWLVDHSPLFAEAIAGSDIHGPADVEILASSRDGAIQADIRCVADQLQWRWGGPIRRIKPAGAPLRLHLAGRMIPRPDGAKTVHVDLAKIDLAQSSVRLDGYAVIDPNAVRPPVAGWRPRWLGEFRASVHAVAAVEGRLADVLAELSPFIRKYGLAGVVGFDARIDHLDESLSVRSHIDARKLSANWRGKLTKPLDLPAEATVEITAPASLATVHLNNLLIRLGDVTVLAGASARLRLGADGLPTAVEPVLAQVAVSTTRAETLHLLAPSLAELELGGRAMIEWTWAGDWRSIPQISLHQADLRGLFRGKDVALRGDVLLENVHLPAGGGFGIGLVKTDGLELRAGRNHAWLFADVESLPDRPGGEVRLLAEYIDDKDLLDWLVPAAAQSDEPSPPLTAAETADLRRRAEDLIGLARKHLLSADLTVRASVEDLRTYDASVRKTYHALGVEASISAERGLIELEYTAGLNGGIMPTRLTVDLAEAIPVVSKQARMRQVVATTDFQPQLAKYFPGNTVEGFFSRDETTTMPLRDVLANAIDVRYPLRPAGEAKTITTDGFVVGRSAPEFLANIFPGLNLSKYHYRKMTAFAELLPDGSAVNDMIFSGKPIDIYIEGTTDTENIGRYEIGVILLGTPQSPEFIHTYRQGRIPLMKFRGLIQDGKIHDEQVSYLWPPEVLYIIFLKNNPVYRIWLNAQKR